MIRVLLADDHAIVRSGLKQILESDPGIRVVCEAGNGTEAVEFVRNNTIDVVVMDITMPGRNGLDALKDIKRIDMALPVLVLSMHPQEQYAVRVLRAGAAGYITKESAPDELVTAIKKAYRGGKYISTEVAELLAVHIERGDISEPHKLLSDREFEVFILIGQGKSLTEIGEELSISVKTVSTYRTRIIEKTGISTNSSITRYCVQHSLS
jgi:two-component system invasion response regulator UvrY